MSLQLEYLVWCDTCCSWVDERDATYLGKDVGPDLLYYDVYICDDCQELIDIGTEDDDYLF